MKKKGYRYLAACFFIGLIFLVFEDGVNHSPVSQIPYSNKIVYGCFITVVPLYVFLRDSGWLCPEGATCCRRRGGYMEMFCMAMGEFWDYGMMAICSVGVPVCGLWSAMACHDVQIELGHWVPFLGFLAYGGILLYFSGPTRRNSMNLQYAEGWCWIAWGIVFNVYFIPGSGGGLFYRFFHGGQSSSNWMPDQQHIFQAIFYIFVGACGIVLGRLNVKTGIHIFMLGWGMYSMLGVHPQFCLLARDMHRLGGQLFFAVGVLRFMNRILEASLVMTILSGAFVFSSSCTVTYADANFEPMSWVTFVVMSWGTWWAYVAYLFSDHWNMPLDGATADQNGHAVPKKYVAVTPEDDEDALENGK